MNSKDYHLSPADVLQISVVGLREFSGKDGPWLEVKVSNSGRLHLPYVGVLSVNGMTPSQLESEIGRTLQVKGMVKDPQIMVRVKDYRGHTIYIIGEVTQPGQYYLRGETYLMDLIALSLGVPTEGTMYLYRRVPADERASESTGEVNVVAGETEVAEAVKIDIQELAEGKRPDLNLRLQGGDVLYVPFNRPKYFYATGELTRPGSFEIPPSRRMLISQAISLAGGPTKTAKMSKGFLIRYDQSGARQEMAVDFASILKGEKPDFPILPNDILFIPGSNAKNLGYGLLNIIPTIATMSFIY